MLSLSNAFDKKDMIDFTLSSEQELIKETAKDFANTYLLPGVIERDEDQKFPKDEIKKFHIHLWPNHHLS